MNYEDLAETQAKRAAKEEASASKGKDGRKRKCPATQETATRKVKKARRSELEVAEDETPQPGWRTIALFCSCDTDAHAGLRPVNVL